MLINIQYKFQEISLIGYLGMAEDGKKSLKFRQSKGDNSIITHDTLKQLHVHNLIMVIYIQYKFHEIPSIGYLVMAEDGKKSLKFRQSKGNSSAITGNTQKYSRA